MAVRCKFRCDRKTQYKITYPKEAFAYEYEFSAVTSGSEENKKFWSATPSGTLKISTVNDGTFEVGKEYYLDIEVAA